MRSRAMSMILIASAAACAPSAPATRPSPDADAPPVRSLLSERDRLSLSSEQVVALDSISRKLDVADRSSGRSRRSIKRALAARASSAKQPDRALALVAGSHRSAMHAVEQLLRPEQRERLCDLQREREASAALRRDKRAGAGHSLASGMRRSEKRRGWPWCSSGPSRSSTAAQSES